MTREYKLRKNEDGETEQCDECGQQVETESFDTGFLCRFCAGVGGKRHTEPTKAMLAAMFNILLEELRPK